MKKVLVFIIAMLVCACSTNDDDSQDNSQDLIIGIWKPDYEVIVYSNGNQENKTYSVCELKNRITFGEAGNFYMTNYPEGDDPNCEELVGNLYQSGNWTKISTSVYEIELTCMVPGCESIIERPDEITFPSKNSMKVKQSDDDPDISYYLYHYTRVE